MRSFGQLDSSEAAGTNSGDTRSGPRPCRGDNLGLLHSSDKAAQRWVMAVFLVRLLGTVPCRQPIALEETAQAPQKTSLTSAFRPRHFVCLLYVTVKSLS